MRSYPGDDRYSVTEDGQVIGMKGAPLRPDTIKGGYRRVRIGGVHKLVHVVIAETFIGPRPLGMQVNHKDGDKDNNAASNLEYVTPSANVRHSLDELKVKRTRGEGHGLHKLTESDVRDIRARRAAGEEIQSITASYPVNQSTIERVIYRQTWRHVA